MVGKSNKYCYHTFARMPLLSVIVPIYNAADTITACIESIREQTLTDIQIILVDDGSTDGSAQVIDRHAAVDVRIRAIHQTNCGRTEARAAGVRMATTEWVTFVDADDTLPDDALEKLFSKASSEVDIVLGNAHLLPNESRDQIPMSDFRHLAVRGEGTIGLPWGSLYRRSSLPHDAFDLPREIAVGEDYIFWLRLVFSSDRPVNTVYERVYTKGPDHSNIRWTADYAALVDRYRIAAIPQQERKDYMADVTADRLTNLFTVAIHQPRRHWQNSPFYRQTMADIRQYDITLPLKKRLFLRLPARWLRKAYSLLGNLIFFLKNRL